MIPLDICAATPMNGQTGDVLEWMFCDDETSGKDDEDGSDREVEEAEPNPEQDPAIDLHNLPFFQELGVRMARIADKWTLVSQHCPDDEREAIHTRDLGFPVKRDKNQIGVVESDLVQRFDEDPSVSAALVMMNDFKDNLVSEWIYDYYRTPSGMENIEYHNTLERKRKISDIQPSVTFPYVYASREKVRLGSSNSDCDDGSDVTFPYVYASRKKVRLGSSNSDCDDNELGF